MKLTICRLYLQTCIFIFAAGDSLFSQPCTFSNVVLTSQEEIDNFPINFPNCNEMAGNLTIFESIPGDITNLLGLKQLTKLRTLDIKANQSLVDLTGLDSLTVVTHKLRLSNCPVTNLLTLSNIEEVEELDITQMQELDSLEGLHNIHTLTELTVFGNNKLKDLKGLRGLQNINPTLDYCYNNAAIRIFDNPLLVDLKGLEGFTNLETCFLIRNNVNIVSLDGLENLEYVKTFLVRNNPKLTKLEALSKFKRCQLLDIRDNDSLLDLSDFSNLESIEETLLIGENAALINLNGLANVTSTLEGNLTIYDNASLSSIDGIANMTLKADIIMRLLDNPNLSKCSISNICTFLGNGSAIETLEGNLEDCNTIAGIINNCEEFSKIRIETFFDENGNKIKDSNERIRNDAAVMVEPDSVLHYPHTAPGGILILPEGDFTVSFHEPSTSGWSLTTDSSSFELNIQDTFLCDTLYFGLEPNAQISELQPFITHGLLVCNSKANFIFGIKNNGTTIAEGIFWIEIDPIISSFVFTNPPDEISPNNEYGWYFSELYPGETFVQKIAMDIPGPPIIQPSIPIELTTFSDFTDLVGTHATDLLEYNGRVLCSFDPNDKLVIPARDDFETLFDEKLLYTIRFQNTGNYFAKDIFIKDTLNELLDVNSFRMLHTSHPNQLVTTVENDNTLTFTFDNIYLPDSSNNLLGSQGHVSFMISPLQSLPENTLISNQASIYFDLNPPIHTNVTKNILVEQLVPLQEQIQKLSFNLSPNPTNEKLQVELFGLENYHLSIFDLHGQLQNQFEVEGTESIDVSYLSPGVYFVKIVKGMEFGVQRFIKI